MPKHRRHRAGRPRKDGARRRATTTAGRRPETDLGSPELVRRKARAANGSGAAVELVDIAGILHARELISIEELVILRQVAGWLRRLALAFGLRDDNSRGLWISLLSGQRGGSGPTSTVEGADAALRRLAEIHAHFGRIGALARLGLVLRVASGESRPSNAHDLAELRAGLAIVRALQRRGRGRAPEQLAAE